MMHAAVISSRKIQLLMLILRPALEQFFICNEIIIVANKIFHFHTFVEKGNVSLNVLRE